MLTILYTTLCIFLNNIKNKATCISEEEMLVGENEGEEVDGGGCDIAVEAKKFSSQLSKERLFVKELHRRWLM